MQKASKSVMFLVTKNKIPFNTFYGKYLICIFFMYKQVHIDITHRDEICK